MDWDKIWSKRHVQPLKNKRTTNLQRIHPKWPGTGIPHFATKDTPGGQSCRMHTSTKLGKIWLRSLSAPPLVLEYSQLDRKPLLCWFQSLSTHGQSCIDWGKKWPAAIQHLQQYCVRDDWPGISHSCCPNVSNCRWPFVHSLRQYGSAASTYLQNCYKKAKCSENNHFATSRSARKQQNGQKSPRFQTKGKSFIAKGKKYHTGAIQHLK